MKNFSKISKATPNKKRAINPTLASFQHFNSYIDLPGYCYEIITEFKDSDLGENELSIGEDLLKIKETIQIKLGIEKYVELLLFIKYLREKYVTDLRLENPHVATKRSLIYFDTDGTKIINDNFNALLIVSEMEKFNVKDEILEKLSIKMMKKKGEKNANKKH
jgi:hypothetical protein